MSDETTPETVPVVPVDAPVVETPAVETPAVETPVVVPPAVDPVATVVADVTQEVQAVVTTVEDVVAPVVDPAVALKALVTQLKDNASAISTALQTATSGKISAGETVKLLLKVVTNLVHTAEAMGDSVSNSDKKAAVAAEVLLFFKTSIEPMHLLGAVGVPGFVEDRVIDPILERILPGLIDGAISYVVDVMHEFNLVK